MAARSFRFAVLRTERTLAQWERTSTARLQEAGGDLVAVVIAPDPSARSGRIARFAEDLAQGTRRPASGGSDPAPGARIRLGAAGALEAIRDLELDFVLALEPTGTFLDVIGDAGALARRGVWTYTFADEDERATLPAGFDAVTRGQPLALVSLVRLTASGTGEPLEQEWLRVEPSSYHRTRAALTGAAAELTARCVRRDVPPADVAPPLRLPMTDRRDGLSAARLLAALTARAVARLVRRVLFRQDWNVGVIQRPITEMLAGLDALEIEWLPERPGDTFLADPFGIPLPDGTCLLLAEEYVGATARGRIVAATIEGSRYVSPPYPVLELGVHLSYPYVVPDDEEGWVMAPESSAASELALYRLGSGSDRAQRESTLLEGFAAVDPTIVEYDGRWWLFATDATRNVDGHLHIWYGQHARGPWTAHALNPVKCDVRSARPGGTPFVVDGVLYRPAQDSGQVYGSALVINRIDVLTPDAFGETTVARLDPDRSGSYPAGIHTLSAVGEATLVDGKRYRFAPLSKLRRHMPRSGG